MAVLKYIQRVHRIHNLIRRKATGTPEEFSEKMGISVSMLYEYLKEMKELGAPIEYCKFRRSYHYPCETDFQMGFVKKELEIHELQNIEGGFVSALPYLPPVPLSFQSFSGSYLLGIKSFR